MNGHGQPALLYLVPCTLGISRVIFNESTMHLINQLNAEHFAGITVILGLVRKELRDLWNYGTQEPSASDVNPSPGA